jgi:hypothetical protein
VAIMTSQDAPALPPGAGLSDSSPTILPTEVERGPTVPTESATAPEFRSPSAKFAVTRRAQTGDNMYVEWGQRT